MKNHFQIYKLRDLEKNKGDLVSGPFGSDISAKFFVDEGVPVIRGNNMKSNDKPFIDDGFVFITTQKAQQLHKCTAIKDDLIFTAVGTIGQVAIIPEKTKYEFYIISNKQIRLRVNPEIAYPYFVYYQLSSKSIRKYLEGQNRGSSIPLLNLAEIRNVSILLPSLPIQRQIASILSSYDELIENNKQRIKLLEEMAEEIYKEWFVRMRFPGYETAKFFNELGVEVKRGTEGALPEGWEKVKINDAFGIQGGGTPSTEIIEFWKDGTINWFSPTDITGSKSIFLSNSAKQITDNGLKNSSAKLFPEKSVMMTSRATIGAVGINLTPACTNQGFITCIPNEQFTYPYIYEWIKANKDLIVSFSTGATFKEIARGVFKNLDVLKVGLNVQIKYTELVEPFYNEIQLLGEKNQLLQQTRDLLLPRLISGMLSVEHLLTVESEGLLAAEPKEEYGKRK